jgi:hypothetical protein
VCEIFLEKNNAAPEAPQANLMKSYVKKSMHLAFSSATTKR